jgi:hypothetical protein
VRGRRRRAEWDGATAEPVVSLAGPGEDCADARVLRRCWRELIKRIYEVEPLICPTCQAEMRIIAFIVDYAVVDRILRHLDHKRHERARPARVC